MSKEPDKLDWTVFFEDKGINTDDAPFCFIKKQEWAHKCTHIVLKPGEELINPLTDKSPANCLYVVSQGCVGIGDYVKEGDKFYCVEKANLGFGSILLEAETPMDIDGRKYVGITPQQTAWASSELLSKVMAYTYEDRKKNVKGDIKYSERKVFANEAILLQIPFECIQNFVSTEELRAYMYKDAFHKSRRYWLLSKGVDYEAGRKADATASLLEALWKHCLNNGLCADNKVYILSVDRTNAILGIPGGVNRRDSKTMSEMPIIDAAIPRIEQDGFKLNRIKRVDLPDDLRSFYDYAYPGNERGGKGSPYEIEVVSYNDDGLFFA